MPTGPARTPSAVAELLTARLLPFEDPALPTVRDGSAQPPDFWRFVDAPPAVVTEVLAALPESVATGRPNGQPPALWLLGVSWDTDGRLYGSVHASRNALRVDGVCVPGTAAVRVVHLLEQAWPGQAEVAVVEGWAGWDAKSPLWTGMALDLLEPQSPLPPFCTVCGGTDPTGLGGRTTAPAPSRRLAVSFGAVPPRQGAQLAPTIVGKAPGARRDSAAVRKGR